jgi:type IV/VI secretion system ImpK/VasF family protein
MAYTVCLLGEEAKEQRSYSDIAEHYEKLVARARTTGAEAGFAQSQWRECLFAVCAWVDEMIFCSDWPDREKWQEWQLQHHFFDTTNGGQEFFDHLDQLSPNDVDVREVYDLCLAMGFKGRYFMSEDAGVLEEISRNNYAALREGSAELEMRHLLSGPYGEAGSDKGAHGFAQAPSPGHRVTFNGLDRTQPLFPEAYATGMKKGHRSFGYLLLAGLVGVAPIVFFGILYYLFQGKLSRIVSNCFH